MTVSFTVQGPPQGKARPRVCRINGKSVTYMPRKTVKYERLIRARFVTELDKLHTEFSAGKDNEILRFFNEKNQTLQRPYFEKDIALEMKILALFPMPKNVSKRVKKSMLDGDILPTKKPDCDNVIKVICDALNGVAYADDKQICKIHFEKKYTQNPCVMVEIKDILEEKRCQER